VDHHTKYDAKFEQAKRWQPSVLKMHRAELYEAVQDRDFLRDLTGGSDLNERRRHDREKFEEFEAWLSETDFMNIMFSLDHETIQTDEFKVLARCEYLREKPSFRFINDELNDALNRFLLATDVLTEFIAVVFKPPTPGHEFTSFYPGLDYAKPSDTRYRNEKFLYYAEVRLFEQTYRRLRRLVQELLYV
jgi:hypothetical protein